MLDLYRSSRDDLIALINVQREALADRDRRLEVLEAEITSLRAAIVELTVRLGEALGAGEPPDGEPGGAGAVPPPAGTPRGMPGLKPVTRGTRPDRARHRRARGFARRRMVATTWQVHEVKQCPDCGVPLAGGSIKRSREVIELPLAPVVVTSHVYKERRCPVCKRRWVPSPELAGVVVGQSRLGIGLVSLIAVLREDARLPFATIQGLLQSLYHVDLSVGALVGAVGQVAARAEPVVDAIRVGIRASPVVHADETGWREDGRNGYAWTLSTPTHRYFIRGKREKAVLVEALGAEFAGVLVSDFYVAYTNYDGRHQYCWAHLLRDIHDLAVGHPRAAGVRGWADAVHGLYERARAVADPDPVARRAMARAFQLELRTLCAPYLPGSAPGMVTAAVVVAPPQRTLCQRIEKHLADLFVFVEDPAVPPTNNAAERSLRHLVVCRKISGGTRSAAGTTAKMRLGSLFGTWRAQQLNPFDECRTLLATPQV